MHTCDDSGIHLPAGVQGLLVVDLLREEDNLPSLVIHCGPIQEPPLCGLHLVYFR